MAIQKSILKPWICISAVACIFFLFTGSASASDISVTVYGDINYPPFSFERDGQPTGIYYDILTTAFARIKGYQVRIKAIQWELGLKKIAKGEIFALYPPYRISGQRGFMMYSEPILDEAVTVFCNESVLADAPRPDWPEDYFGLAIGNNKGFRFDDPAFFDAVDSGKIRLVEENSVKENMLHLRMGVTDCYLGTRISIYWELERLTNAGEIRKSEWSMFKEGTPEGVENGYLGFSKQGGKQFSFMEDFMHQFNTVINEMKENGEVRQIVDRWIQLPPSATE